MKIAITGASGFIGSNFIKNNTDISISEIDLLTKGINEIDFSGIDTILHLAALVHQMKGAPAEEYYKINRDLAYETAKRAKNNGVKHFVFMSTAKVYGEKTRYCEKWDENSKCHPVDPYGKSKFEGELLIKSLQDDKFSVAIVRSPLVYGIGVKANMYNLLKLVDTCFILPLGGINNKRSIVYVGNIIALLRQIIDLKSSGIFIAGDRKSISTTEIIQDIAKILNKKLFLIKTPQIVQKILIRIFPSIFDRLYGSLELDNYGTNKTLNFEPPYSTIEGLKVMLDWYKNQ